MHKHQISPIVKVVLFSFIVLMAIRITLYNFYKNDFSDLSTYEFLYSMFMGFRVDMITIFTFSSIFILFLLFIKGTKKRVIVGITWALVLNMIFILSFSDVLYYEEVNRHMSSEIFNLGNDMDIITSMALGSMLPYTIGATIFSIIFLYITFKTFTKDIHNFIDGKHLAIIIILTILILFIGIRNNLNSKAFGTTDAYAVNKVSSGNLALNGFFTVYRTAKETVSHNLIGLPEAIKITQDAISSSNTKFTNKDYPLMRHYSQKDKPKHNVVIVLIESFGAEHLDGFTKYTEIGITPYFKKLSQEGLKFTNFYGNGQRSIFGITSIFTGITYPKGFNYLGKGLELSTLSYLGNTAKQNGYSTVAMQGANRRSYRVDSISNLAGFDEYYGAEDMPNVEDVEGDRKPHTGTFDYNLLDFYRTKLSKMKEPFLGFAFTSTTHADFMLPHSKYEKYPHDLKNYNGRLNAMSYLDDSIARFMEKAKKEPWFDNTVFIFTADHARGSALDPIGKEYRPNSKSANNPMESMRIPLIIYAPKIFEPKELNTLGSLNDIFPSIVDMLGWEANISTIGNSLFDSDIKTRFAYIHMGSIALITDDGHIRHNFKDIVAKSVDDKDLEKTKKLLFAIDTAEAQLLLQNRWAK